MKRILLAIILFLSIGFAAPLQAQDPPTATPVRSFVLATDIFVRAGPGEQYEAVGALLAGAFLQPVNRSADGLWVMITYTRGYGWIRRDLAYWVEDIDALPIMDTSNLTPFATSVDGAIATPFIPTQTPTGNWVNVSGIGVYVRAGPGRGYLRLGALAAGQRVQPVGRTADNSWIMIRYNVGEFQFAWIQRILVNWVEDLTVLPVLSEEALTPTPTFTRTATATASYTPTATATPTDTATATLTATATATYTPTETATATSTFTETATATLTPTSTPTETSTATNTATATDIPSETPQPTETPLPTETSTATETATTTASPTTEPTVEILIVPTELPSNTPTEIVTIAPTETATIAATEIVAATTTPTLVDTLDGQVAAESTSITATATETLSPFVIASNMPASATVTETTLAVAVEPTGLPTAQPVVETPSSDSPADGFPIEAIVGGGALLVVLGYVALYWRGLSAADRYSKGFVITQCPVCGVGNLEVETRPGRLLGIPRTRHIVRCTNCRSVLRETGNQRWRYAVDRIENPQLYDRLNGREINEAELTTLAQSAAPIPPVPRAPVTPPKFMDDEQQ